MKRIIIKYTIFLLLIFGFGLIYFLSSKEIRNTLYGMETGVICIIVAERITDILHRK